MKIFFAGSMRGGRSMLPVYMQIVQIMKEMGHEVLSEDVATEELEESKVMLTDDEIFDMDIRFIEECDYFVADVTVNSIGVGYEICYAVSKGKPTLCVYMQDTNISAMLLGNRSVTSIPYLNIVELQNSLSLHLK